MASQIPANSKTVAVLSERSEDAVVGFLACLLGQFRYLPLDPEFPLKRLETMVGMAEPDFYLASASLKRILPWSAGLTGALNPGSIQSSGRGGSSANSGYVLFTSGTRGTPRGVLVSGKALDSYAWALNKQFQPQIGSVYHHTASFAFSASVRQLLLPLTSGGHLIIAGSEERRNPVSLLRQAWAHQVNILDTVPSHLRILSKTLERWPKWSNPWLKEVRVTGEPLRWADVRGWRKLVPGAKLWNLYSQTETGGTVSCYCVGEEQPNQKGPVPLGYPLPDMAVSLVDSDGREGDDGRFWFAASV